MSFWHSIILSKTIRAIDINIINNTNRFYLRKLFFKFLYVGNNKNEKYSGDDAYNELEIIEIYVNNIIDINFQGNNYKYIRKFKK